ncbi:MAG TPA: C-GCAxxG-C-C family protein [Spirochaetota bacterium]|nr:C-GCAxxG-C-C family protein [Spirochaetota bacterium]
MSPAINKSAIDYHKEGFNCAESIFLAFRERVAPEISTEAVRMATPFGAGMGHAGCLCGALAGSVMIIGILKGRTTPDVPRKEPYALSGEFHNRFKERFGATCCRVLNRHRFGTAEQGATCGEIINGTEEILSEFLREKGLV